MPDSRQRHRNDIYGELDEPAKSNPAIPAATVVLLRDGDGGTEALMLRKNSKIAFGGMWVFPGGRIDEEDYGDDPDDRDSAARIAAVREAEEEAGLRLDPSAFVWFAHWTPPASTPVRFATYFFVAAAEASEEVAIDHGEIEDHRWIRPAEALKRHAESEIDLAPPTWVTLYHVSRRETTANVVKHFAESSTRYYETHIAQRQDGVRVAMWRGDAGYVSYDADQTGAMHRLVMREGGFEFLHDAVEY